MARSIEQSRKIRALEAKRDSLIEQKQKAQATLAQIRAQLSHEKKK